MRRPSAAAKSKASEESNLAMFKSGRPVASNAYGLRGADGVERVAYGCNAPVLVVARARDQLFLAESGFASVSYDR